MENNPVTAEVKAESKRVLVVPGVGRQAWFVVRYNISTTSPRRVYQFASPSVSTGAVAADP